MTELRANIGAVFANTGEGLDVFESVEAAPLSVGPDTFEFTAPATVRVSLENVGGLVLVRGDVKVPARVACVRCLEPFDLDLCAEIEAYLVQPGHDSGLPDEVDAEFVEGDWVDLWPIAEAALAEEAPFAPVHDDDCKGICATCGADLNAQGCECENSSHDSPFAVLKDLFDEDVP